MSDVLYLHQVFCSQLLRFFYEEQQQPLTTTNFKYFVLNFPDFCIKNSRSHYISSSRCFFINILYLCCTDLSELKQTHQEFCFLKYFHIQFIIHFLFYDVFANCIYHLLFSNPQKQFSQHQYDLYLFLSYSNQLGYYPIS